MAPHRRHRTDMARLTALYPSLNNLDWAKAFANNMSLYAEIMHDVLKADQAETGRPGPRPKVDRRRAQKRLAHFMGEDHTLLPFVEAVKILSKNASVRDLAEATGLNRNTVFRIMNGKHQPDEFEISQFANAFDKHPSYFVEYRVNFVISALVRFMTDAPEASVGAYHKLRKALDN